MNHFQILLSIIFILLRYFNGRNICNKFNNCTEIRFQIVSRQNQNFRQCQILQPQYNDIYGRKIKYHFKNAIFIT